MKTYRIHLLRHGVTRGNLEGRYIGTTDLALCEEGERELRTLWETYLYPEADVFYASPLLRCTQSLSVLYPHARPQLVPRLAECDFGLFEGYTAAQLGADAAFAEWMAGKRTAPPQGESGEDFSRRCLAGFDEVVRDLSQTDAQDAVVMTHGGVIMTVLAACGLPRLPFQEWKTPAGQGFTVRVTPSLWMRDRVIEVLGAIPMERS